VSFNQTVLLDTDAAEVRVSDEVYVNDRGITPEYSIYTKEEFSSQLYIFIFKSQKELLLYDQKQSDESDGVICNIFNSSYPDIGRLRNDRYEPKQENRIYLTTSNESCDDKTTIQYFNIDIEEDIDATYTVRQVVTNKADIASNQEEQLTIENVSYPLLLGKKSSADPTETSPAGLVLFADNSIFGKIGFNTRANILDFYTQVSSDEEDLYKLWSHNFTYALNEENKPIEPIILSGTELDSDSIFLINGNELFKLSKSSLFNLGSQIERQLSLLNPIYTWSSSLPITEENFIRLSSSQYALLDDKKVLVMDSSNQITLVKDYSSDSRLGANALSLRTPDGSLVVSKQLTDQASMHQLTLNGLETTIQGLTSGIYTYGNRPIYDFISNSQRFAQSNSGSGPEHTLALENSAWMPLKNYLEDRQELYILNSDSSTEGLLDAPLVYAYDKLAPNGQDTQFAAIPGDVALVLEAAIISKTFGMIWVQRSFSSDTNIDAYYFNPSNEKPYQLTLVDDDAELPTWLPYIEE
jgi:hypothetical protein